MEIRLSEQCEAIQGSLHRNLGYSIQRQKGKYVSKRNSRGYVPEDGHWKFIAACAELAHRKLHVTDIKVSADELQKALYEAYHFVAAEHIRRTWDAKRSYNAADILNLKTSFGL